MNPVVSTPLPLDRPFFPSILQKSSYFQEESVMKRTMALRSIVVTAALLIAGCGNDTKEPRASTPSGSTPPVSVSSGETAVPTSPAEITSEVKATLSKARSAVETKKLEELHGHAARLWSLTAGLRAAKAPYGRMFQLARDLDAQGDAGNAAGAAEVLTALEKESAQPAADVPDDRSPLTAHVHEYACPMQCEGKKTYDKPGTCPVCEMNLEPVVAGAFAHSHHEPQHGGQFIMAEDNWHHVEGTLPKPTLFKMYLYDNFSKPFSAVGVTATLQVTTKHRDRKAGTSPETMMVDVAPGPEGTTLVAAIPEGMPWPIATRAVVTFPGKSPFTFDFQFKDLSIEPAPGSVPAGHSHAAADVRPIPGDMPGILAALDEVVTAAKGKVDSGALAELHTVADRLGRLATALEVAGGKPGRLSRLAKDLDEQGDSGNKPGALEVIAAIAKDVEAAKK